MYTERSATSMAAMDPVELFQARRPIGCVKVTAQAVVARTWLQVSGGTVIRGVACNLTSFSYHMDVRDKQ
jgi:hypothetical protein